jgi:Bax protein
MKSDNPYELVKKLDKYSERGDEYGKELASIIKYNKFCKYDGL